MDGTTHYEGCWRSGEAKHMLCALQVIKDAIAVLPDNIDALFKAVEKKNILGFKDQEGATVSEIDYLNKTITIDYLGPKRW